MLDRSARLGFATSTLDREGARRADPAHVASRLAAPGARFVALAGDAPVLRREGEALSAVFDRAALEALRPEEAPGGDGFVYLGLQGETPLFGAGLPAGSREALAARADLLVTDMRSLAVGGLVDDRAVGTLGTAKALLDWHARHRFCAACGRPTAFASAGWRRDCVRGENGDGEGGCGAQHFPRVDPVAIMLVVDEARGLALVGRQPRFPPGVYSCLAGFIEPGETLEDAVRREVLEEAGVRVARVDYSCAQPWPFPSSLMIGCRGVVADAPGAAPAGIVLDEDELEDARWITREDARLMLEGAHPAGLRCPPRIAIAHHLLRDFAGEG